jgi:DNA-binding XRE family transcriptional regulator
MPAVTKKPRTEDETVTLKLRVRRRNASKIRDFARAVEETEGRAYSADEVFPEFLGKEQRVALRGYRYREGLTQKQLARITGIPQRHISEMENGKRGIGKERARKLAEALNVSDWRFFIE